jgi:acyl carrier protein
MKKNIKEIVFEYLQKRYPDSLKSVKIEDDFSTIIILDSMSIMDLTFFLEEEFKIKIYDQDMTFNNFSSFFKIVEYIEKNT